MNSNSGLLLIAMSFALASCHSDEVTSEYYDLGEARRAGAFERGWLPPVLPQSSLHIVECNDLDSNLGSGSFDFDPADLKPYLEHVRNNLAAEIEEKDGISVIRISSKETRWILNLPKDGKRASFNSKLLH